jgi:hypothetical protein
LSDNNVFHFVSTWLLDQKFTESLWPGSKRQTRPSVLREIELCEHLAAILTRANPEDELVTPPRGFASGLNDVGQRKKKSPAPFRIHAHKYGARRASAQTAAV